MTNLLKQWNEACLSADISAISLDTSARIMAVLYVLGNNEAFVYNQKFLDDVEYIRQRFHIYGTGIVPIEFAKAVKKYSDEIEEYEKAHKNDKIEGEAVFKSNAPKWAIELFKDRYNIKLIN